MCMYPPTSWINPVWTSEGGDPYRTLEAGASSSCLYAQQAVAVARRNQRERNRVRTINSTFTKLRQRLPCSHKKKLSKVDTLRGAIKYIRHLQQVLDCQDKEQQEKRGQDESETQDSTFTIRDADEMKQEEDWSCCSEAAPDGSPTSTNSLISEQDVNDIMGDWSSS